MLLLRKGGKFADRQIDNHRWKAVLFFSVSVLVILVTLYVNLPYVGIAAAVLTLGMFKTTRRRWRNWMVGKRGEEAVSEALKSLPNDYVLLNDLMLPNGRGNVDHLVIGPNGLLVIETKNYSGYVKCWADDWYVNGRKVSSLSKQAKGNAIAIKNTLEAIFTEHRTRLPYVHALLCFVNSRSRLKLGKPTIPVLRCSELARFIGGYGRGPKVHPMTSPDLTRAIVHHLHLLQQKPDKLVANG
jgi:hypothetical protein